MARAASPPRLTRAAVYDLLKGAIIVLATVTLGYVQVSRVYHYIRGEAVIKLYVVYNVLSMGDGLLASLGQDIMDALYRTTRDALGGEQAAGGSSDGNVKRDIVVSRRQVAAQPAGHCTHLVARARCGLSGSIPVHAHEASACSAAEASQRRWDDDRVVGTLRTPASYT